MSITFSGELGQLVSQQLSLGKYGSESEVLLEGMRLLTERDRRLAELRAGLHPALERLDRGEGQPLDIESIKAEGRRILSDAGGNNR